jgi:hypothetical protein
MEDPEMLSKREQKRKAARERELLRHMELAAMGEVPLINPRRTLDDEEGNDANSDEEPGDAYTLGESRRQVSWIWTLAGRSGSDEEMLEGEISDNGEVHLTYCFIALRIEWCKSYARTRRWREEVRILGEEWRRMPISLAYIENQWKDRAAKVPVGTIPAGEAEGMIAYAVKQAAMYANLIKRAEVTRTEPKLANGYRRSRPRAATAYSALNGDAVVGGSDEDDNEDDDENDGEHTDDEELLMGGEVDDD